MDIIKELTDKDDKRAYALMKEITAASEFSSEYYSYLDSFASLLSDKKSYIRTRAFILCCSQARWDNEGRLAKLLPLLITLFHDEKPTVVRQCLHAAKELVAFRPELSEAISVELGKIDFSRYKESMATLIRADVDELSKLISSDL